VNHLKQIITIDRPTTTCTSKIVNWHESH